MVAGATIAAHDPGTALRTAPAARWVVTRGTTRTERDADPAQALRGQHARGRTVRPEAFDRHVAAADGPAGRLRRGEVDEGRASVRVLDRTDTGRGLRVDTTPAAGPK
ncbi:hypothetical protein [Pseudonocardia dioxanivorans]|uniref:hypothetical protein n=1 Tax=Pseudonocardia dioxanivorans TaxID=240495 RepID=UPI000CD08229|nr:hypothetical protein [Pseudonocardia dioxanivorans]